MSMVTWQAGTKRRGAQRAVTRTLPRATGRVSGGRKGGSFQTGSERIRTIEGSTGYNVYRLDLNPAQSAAFPWLTAISAAFDKYQFRRLRFRYVAATGTDVQGTVCLAFDPEALDSSPATMVELTQMSSMVQGPPWASFALTVPLDRRERYTRPNGSLTPLSADLKSYDIGNLLIATEGMSSTDEVGYVVAEYECELKVPQPIPTARTNPEYVSSFSLHTQVNLLALADGNVTIAGTWNSAGTSDVTYSAGDFTIPEGVWKVDGKIAFAVTNSAAPGTNSSEIIINWDGDHHALPYVNNNYVGIIDSQWGAASEVITQYVPLCGYITGPAVFNLRSDKTTTGTGAAVAQLLGSATGGLRTFIMFSQFTYN